MTMKDPVRLLDGAGSAAEQDALRAGAAEGPSEAARQRLAAALGLSIEAPLQAEAARTTTTTSGAGIPSAMNAAAPLSAKWLTLALVSLVGFVTLGTIGIGAAVLTQLSRTRVPVAAPRAVTAPVRDTGAPARTEPAASALEPAVTPALGVPIAETTPPSAASPATPRRGKPASLAREIAQLDAVRALLAGGDPNAALAALRDYTREHATGVLAQEAALLRIEALLAHDPGTRAHARARTEAARFLRDNPQSPHANRIQALLDDAR